MSTYSGSSRGSQSRPKRHSVPSIGSTTPSSTNGRPTPSHNFGYNAHAARQQGGHTNGNITSNTPREWRATPQGKLRGQKDGVMMRNREVRPPVSVDIEDSVTVMLSIVGVKFKCLVDKDLPCETLLATAIAKYHAAFPTCEIPDCNVILHAGRKEYLAGTDLIGRCCSENDEIELGIADKPLVHVVQRPENAVVYNFAVVFHRLPLGFIMKQENDSVVVANIYPRSAATHYERLMPGVTVVQIGDTPLESLGLRHVHELIKNAKFPLLIKFRGWRKPIERRGSVSSVDSRSSAKTNDTTHSRQRRQSVPTRGDEKADGADTRPRASTTSAAAAAGIPPLFNNTSEVSTPAGPHTPSPYSQSKQRITTERKKTNAASPYPEHKTIAAGRRTARSNKTSPVMKPDTPAVPTVDQANGHGNQGESPGVALPPPAPLNDAGGPMHHVTNASTDVPMEQVIDKLNAAQLDDVQMSDVDSNQNEEESEEMLVEHIKILQAELIKKHEEAKLLANQLEAYHKRLTEVRTKQGKKDAANRLQQQQHQIQLDQSQQQRGSEKPQPSKVRLTPEVLEAIDSKSGLPPKTASHYASSNASSVSGYSAYSSRSAAAQRHARLARVVGKTGIPEDSMRCDASVSSCNSISSERRRDSAKSPRRKGHENINDRYSYMPPKYSASTQYYDAPSSFSTKGAVIARAKITRDSFIRIPESPGVGAYDIKSQERVRGGEIGDSDRSLPWP